MPDPGTGIAAVGAGGSLLGAAGKGKTPDSVSQSKSGFESYPGEIQEYLIDEIFPRIKDESTKPYYGFEKRAIDEEDTDPIFGSKRRVQYDQMVKDKIKREYLKPTTVGDDTVEDDGSGISGDALAMQYLTGIKQGISTPQQRNLLNAPSLDQKKLGEVLSELGYGTKFFDATDQGLFNQVIQKMNA